MADSKEVRFSWVGQFLAFVPGKKSPCQSAYVQVIAVESGTAGEIQTYQVKLDKDIREIAVDSIKPRSWVQVSGKGKPDKGGQMKWKATNIEAIALQTVAKVKEEAEKAEMAKEKERRSHSSRPRPQLQLVSTKREPAKTKPARILICQKSSCRKKGSQKVSKAVEEAITQADASDRITVKSTGCLKCCKTGPTVVVLPAGSKDSNKAKETHRKVTAKSATKIVASIL